MSRFQFIANEYPEIFALCSEAEKNKRTNVDLSMLKARQALEKILEIANPGLEKDNLVDRINSLYGRCSTFEIDAMHTLRRLCNAAVHGKTLSKQNVNEALKALLLSCCWLYFKFAKKSCPLSMFVQEDRDLVAPYIQTYLGNCYYEGFGVVQNYKEAVMNYQKAAAQGDVNAQLKLAECYANGEGVDKDDKEAVKWCRKAAEQGNADAQNDLGYCYEYGIGVAKNEEEAVNWYRKAANQGFADAQNNLGLCYCEGTGVAKNRENARYWYREAADQGFANAQYNLGVCYYEGEGVEKNREKAVYWYRKAADQGFANAQYNLGVCYYEGKGVEKNREKAVYWFRKAADQGFADALYNLGVCYEYGKGVAKNKEISMRWYKKAADLGQAKAQRIVQKKWCFITTAVCQMLGKPDDCYELTMFRHFRDTWLIGQPDGETLISEYYAIAPGIVKRIDDSGYSQQVYRNIWESYLNPCLHYLENGQYNDCKNLYVEMVTKLKKRFS